MILHDSKTKIIHAGKKLNLRWDQVREQWRDDVSRSLEQGYLDPLGPKLAATVQAISTLGELLERIKKECQ